MAMVGLKQCRNLNIPQVLMNNKSKIPQSQLQLLRLAHSGLPSKLFKLFDFSSIQAMFLPYFPIINHK
jgi:hypothetical protein